MAKKRTTDAMFAQLVARYRSAAKSAIEFGWPYPLRIRPAPDRTFTSWQEGYARGVHDVWWAIMQREWVWCLYDEGTGDWVGCSDALSPAGKLAASGPQASAKSKFVWQKTFKDVVAAQE